ncbi:response regulator [Runella sp.]|jgi:CheY-like chemotaxis protein|uniref:response regulator n=1 Tax=Runella sp. TaxID=1960881 RepID=UPI0026339C37|nr:response regulator [Runella sp.]
MNNRQLHLLLADDDSDDREMFQEALSEVPIAAKLTEVKDGEKLMQWLNQPAEQLPDLLFLDLNMPRKNGHECLEEIKRNPQLQSMLVVIFSTTINTLNVDIFYNNGAHYYIQKPSSFEHLIHVIEQMLHLPEEKRRILHRRFFLQRKAVLWK